MADLTNYAEEAIVGAMFRGAGALTFPATWYVALLTAASSPEAGTVTEVSGGSYARVAVTNNSGSWNAVGGGDGTTENTDAITFPAPTANWGVATHYALYDASTAGNAWVVDALTTPKTINNGDAAPSFAAGALSFQIDN
jgi:hypothetical protein